MPKYQAYVVTVGTEIGVFRKWSDALFRTSGVPGSACEGFSDWYEAQEFFEERHRRGETRIVHVAPPQRKDRGICDVLHRRCRCRWCLHGRGSAYSTGRSKDDLEHVNENKNMDEEENTNPNERENTGKGESRNRRWKKERGQMEAESSVDRGPEEVVPGKISLGQISQDQPRARKMSIGSEPSTTSSPLTAVTQTRNVFSSDEESAGHARNAAPRYTQSLSYASSPSNASAGLRSPSLSESDRRSHLSSPSSLGTRYYPEDWLARQVHSPAPFQTTASTVTSRPAMTRDNTTRGPRVSDGASSTSGMSDYATAPNTPNMDVLEVEELLSANVDVIMAEASASEGQANIVEVISPPPPPTGMLSPRAREREEAAAPGVVSSASTHRNGVRGRRKGAVGRSLSEAQVQTEPQDHFGIGRRKQSDAVVQTVSSPRKQYGVQEVQATRTRTATPLRATANESTVYAPSGHRRGICACMHAECVCRHCGGDPGHAHPMASVANHLPSPATSPASASASVSSVSSASTRTAAISTPRSAYASAVGSFGTLTPSTRASSRSRGQSVRSPTGSGCGAGGGHTPLMGPNELRWDSEAMVNASTFQAAVNAMSFYEPAASVGDGSEAIVHDVSFDPRSPIHRGTSIPAG
ncbi:hypothetical protein C8Q80DRAFT_1122481 [Daedaleopsis nitida]|nr:hypothetical protein C8Q80DRAFT_1122481 [Daedaleopsis nitida]